MNSNPVFAFYALKLLCYLLVLSSLVDVVQPAGIKEKCSTDADCKVLRSSCRPDGCQGYQCFCNKGYIYDRNKVTCEKAANVRESCTGGEKCLSIMAVCQNGICQCSKYFDYVESLQKCSFPKGNIIGEPCDTKDNCTEPTGSCLNGYCACGDGYRMKTEEEFWVDPQNTNECVISSFSLCK
ncbi:hypothetical protein BgiMline_036650 [Biomphalaria glabrata]